VFGSNVGQGTGYPDSDFLMVFLYSSRQMLDPYLKIDHECFHPHLFQSIIHSQPTIQHCTALLIKRVIK